MRRKNDLLRQLFQAHQRLGGAYAQITALAEALHARSAVSR